MNIPSNLTILLIDSKSVYRSLAIQSLGNLGFNGKCIPIGSYEESLQKINQLIKKGEKISAVVFDGIVTQRLLDIASNKNVKEIVGIKLGNVVKMPKTVTVLTKNDFQ